jgi:LysM repeat protein
MKIFRYIFFFFFFFISFGTILSAQKKSQSYVDYINQYNDLAKRQMEKYNIPASITLAQALLESGAGKSELAKNSNNHFGIKCHSDWKGERVHYADDGPNDCFRKYKKVEDSYEDHSKFLKQHARYSVLFTYNIKDYTSWSVGLQKCGYATNKAYANKLIKIIEDYELYKYDSKQKNTNENRSKVSNSKKQEVKITEARHIRPTFVWNGLLYVEAEAGDSFEKIAYDMGFKTKDLLKYNDVPDGFPLTKGDVVYLKKKKKKADLPHFEHLVKIGESMHSISQHYGVELKRLYKLNKKDFDYIPTEGDVLRLR